MTKPIDKDELFKIVTDIKKQLDSDQIAQDTSANYKEKAYLSIMEEILTGDADFSKINIHELHMEHEVFQVVIYERYSYQGNELSYRFSDLLRVTNQNNNSFDAITNGSQEIIILKGCFALKKFEDFLAQYEKDGRRL